MNTTLRAWQPLTSGPAVATGIQCIAEACAWAPMFVVGAYNYFKCPTERKPAKDSASTPPPIPHSQAGPLLLTPHSQAGPLLLTTPCCVPTPVPEHAVRERPLPAARPPIFHPASSPCTVSLALGFLASHANSLLQNLARLLHRAAVTVNLSAQTPAHTQAQCLPRVLHKPATTLYAVTLPGSRASQRARIARRGRCRWAEMWLASGVV